jgi:ribosomal protein S27AE
MQNVQKNKTCERCGLDILPNHKTEYTFSGQRHTPEQCVELLQELIKQGNKNEKRLRSTART